MRKDLKDHNRSKFRGETLGVVASQPCLGVEKVIEMGIGVEVQVDVQNHGRKVSIPKKGDDNGRWPIQKDTVVGENIVLTHDQSLHEPQKKEWLLLLGRMVGSILLS